MFLYRTYIPLGCHIQLFEVHRQLYFFKKTQNTWLWRYTVKPAQVTLSPTAASEKLMSDWGMAIPEVVPSSILV